MFRGSNAWSFRINRFVKVILQTLIEPFYTHIHTAASSLISITQSCHRLLRSSCLRTTLFLLDLRHLTPRRKTLRHAPRRPPHSQAHSSLRSHPSAQKCTPRTPTSHHALHDLIHLQVRVRQSGLGICVLCRPARDGAAGFGGRVWKGVEFIALEYAGEVAGLLGGEGWVGVGDESAGERCRF